MIRCDAAYNAPRYSHNIQRRARSRKNASPCTYARGPLNLLLTARRISQNILSPLCRPAVVPLSLSREMNLRAVPDFRARASFVRGIISVKMPRAEGQFCVEERASRGLVRSGSRRRPRLYIDIIFRTYYMYRRALSGSFTIFWLFTRGVGDLCRRRAANGGG